MAFECLDVDKLDPTIWNDVCIASDFLHNETAWQMTQDAFKTCCPNNFSVTDDGCYTYCNITTPFDTVMMQNCLADTMAPNYDWDQLEWDCYPFAWDEPSTTDTKAGLIATTWSYPDNTWIDTLSNGVVTTETDNYWGTPLTAITTTSTKAAASLSATGSTATKTGSKSPTGSSTSTAPTSSKTTSGAGGGIRLSYGAGSLVALSVLALVL